MNRATFKVLGHSILLYYAFQRKQYSDTSKAALTIPCAVLKQGNEIIDLNCTKKFNV